MDPPRTIQAVAATLLVALLATAATSTQDDPGRPEDFLLLMAGPTKGRLAALERIEKGWSPGSAVMLLEVLFFLRHPAIQERALELLERETGQDLDFDTRAWFDWLWAQESEPHPRYADFKGLLYGNIDPAFGGYFSDDRATTIRLDEVRWGGVRQDGIPPLRSPRMIAAAAASYLGPDDIIFGIEVAGEARAYPKRILAWHEMFVDEVGGVPVTGVYCTLCGTVMLYESEHDGVLHELGTSGFLYRSNKLMYDKATQSLWSTMLGEPVIGPLVGKGIALRRGSVVTTTWQEWRRRHPKTLVLSLDTGHERDYSEGAAYRDYFATDRLMFNVAPVDRRLKNKDEVLALVFPEHPDRPLAIAQEYLVANPLLHERVGDLDFVVLTDRSGANRVYATGGLRFERWNRDDSVVGTDGELWTLTEAALVATDGRRLVRLPSQRAFWFGWYAAFPQTRLVR